MRGAPHNRSHEFANQRGAALKSRPLFGRLRLGHEEDDSSEAQPEERGNAIGEPARGTVVDDLDAQIELRV